MSAAGPKGALPPAALDDPHLQPYAKRERAAERVAIISMAIGVIGILAFGVVYWVGDQTQWEAATLGIGLFGLGFGTSAWGKYLMPQGPFVEERHPFESNEDERAAFAAAVVERGGLVVKRRKVIAGMFAAGSAVLGVVLAFPLIRSLGPKPGRQLFDTDWADGSQVVTVDGRKVLPSDLEVGGVLTVFPKGFEGTSQDQVILIRLAESNDGLEFGKPGNPDWLVQGIVGYSKLCTHLGCPVGLYQQQSFQLVCPCHQSVFNVKSGAIPEFGPAPRALPQLPLGLDANGNLISTGGLGQAPGPGFWERP